ncbi:FAD/NAD(P)-binding domain-containing protein [Annulohypoxylon maeteangense]|uniref:FAD/NAD(P)-binding domain-containing protein n=1 Tax=Annulohypoxylon maeteangense TaxID=1927788 RepID=UPI002007F231|nr:FAD/NAD(P)-binding domain-containing protein [Annulohypoxylon maeteangense]KAI0888930.1 FAD/NAD(P)-binding domain-containing protein [Annulohypoxylon maeteangense]
MSDYRDLRISVIGAGMGGLACALAFAKKGFKHVDVYETASNLGFVGAGIQLAPNMARVLDRWGCWDGILAEATNIKASSIREGSTNRELVHVEMPDIEEKYGYPHCTGHRASLAGGLYEGCKKEPNITFHFSTSLADVKSFGPGKVVFTVQPRNGEAYDVETDVLLGADGIKSVVRTGILKGLNITADVEDTGQAAYRIMLTRAEMEHDPDLLELLDADCALRWIGEKRHIVAYPISNKTIYNLSTCQPDVNFAAATNATYTTRGSKPAMLKVYGDLDPIVLKMLNMVPEGEVCEWRLRSHKPLDSWILGGVALVGDACHPTLPHLSQGAAMAIEDAAVLAEVVSQAPSGGADRDALSKALKVYELLRKERTSILVELAASSARTLHLGDGKAKEERDRQFKEAKKGTPIPDKWASPEVQHMIYSYDCVAEAQEKFDELYATLTGDINGHTNGANGFANGHAQGIAV